MQDMIHAVIVVHALHRRHVGRLLDDADGRAVAFLRSTDGAGIAVREVEAGRAKADLLLCLNDRRGKPPRPLHVHIENMIGKTRRRLCSNAGQRTKLLYELRKRCDMLHLRGVPAAIRARS